MFRLLAAVPFALFFALPLTATAADASDRVRLGYGRLITNDYLGDGQDRERTGAISSSRIWGADWSGSLPRAFGDLIELRLGFAILAPTNLRTLTAADRPYAGSLSAGLHTHFAQGGVEYAVGAMLVVTGPGTGLGSLQREFHDLIGETAPSDAVLDNQIGNGVHPSVVVEAGRSYGVGKARIRPFVEGRAGVETLLRLGVDLHFGQIGQSELMVRDTTSGHHYRTIQSQQHKGINLVMGADLAYVSDSIYLPDDRGYELTDRRDRVRLGVHWQGNNASAFYGLTWHGKEYVGQAEDQLTGSIRVNFSF